MFILPLHSCRRLDCLSHQCTRRGIGGRCYRQVCGIRRDKKPAFELGQTHRLCQGPFAISRDQNTLCNVWLQGYALVEYETMAEAQAAIDGASGTPLFEQVIQCDYAFVRPPPSGPKKGRGGREGRARSASPRRQRD